MDGCELVKLNNCKADFIIFGTKKNLSLLKTEAVMVGGSKIAQSDSVKSISTTLDSTLTIGKQITTTCQTAWYSPV